MRYLTSSTKQKLSEIILKINKKDFVSLSDRIFLHKYSMRLPHLLSKIKEKSLKFS